MITVMGATGQTGGQIALALLAAGARVRALGRNERALAALRRHGAEVWRGDSADPTFLTGAFRDADAAYTLLPTDRRAPDYPRRQGEEGAAIATAIAASGVRHVVALSSLGAELPAGTGVIVGLHEQEQRLAALATAELLFLRPVSFFENFYDALAPIKAQGSNADAVASDLAIPMIATRDIAAVAARALLARDWQGRVVRELLGQRDLTYREATQILGARIGRPDLPYIQLPYAEMAAALVHGGLSASFAERYVAMTHAFNTGLIRPGAGRTAENTTPTRFEDFADQLAHAYHAM